MWVSAVRLSHGVADTYSGSSILYGMGPPPGSLICVSVFRLAQLAGGSIRSRSELLLCSSPVYRYIAVFKIWAFAVVLSSFAAHHCLSEEFMLAVIITFCTFWYIASMGKLSPLFSACMQNLHYISLRQLRQHAVAVQFSHRADRRLPGQV